MCHGIFPAEIHIIIWIIYTVYCLDMKVFCVTKTLLWWKTCWSLAQDDVSSPTILSDRVLSMGTLEGIWSNTPTCLAKYSCYSWPYKGYISSLWAFISLYIAIKKENFILPNYPSMQLMQCQVTVGFGKKVLNYLTVSSATKRYIQQQTTSVSFLFWSSTLVVDISNHASYKQ